LRRKGSSLSPNRLHHRSNNGAENQLIRKTRKNLFFCKISVLQCRSPLIAAKSVELIFRDALLPEYHSEKEQRYDLNISGLRQKGLVWKHSDMDPSDFEYIDVSQGGPEQWMSNTTRCGQ
jgi:hypothetical protein